MKAAVVTDAGRPPRWTDFAKPVSEAGETLASVTAAALSPLAQARASGQHYSSTKADAFVAGVDGVGRLDDGRRVYFAFVRSPFGAIAEIAPVRLERTAQIPDELDDVTAAAMANPAMSSWGGLRDRAKMQPGESVLINGATGAAGKLAVQIAKHLGAKTVIATGRNAQQLEAVIALGADRTIPLTLPEDRLIDAMGAAIFDNDVSIVLDYLWGASALQLLTAIARNQAGEVAQRIRFVQIGAVSGAVIPLDGSLLRSSGVELLGSGLRSVSLPRLVSGIGEAFAVATSAGFHVDTATQPMETVEQHWNDDTGGRRLVFTRPS